MLAIYKTVARVARLDTTVLIRETRGRARR
jgi:hypothetical protein